MIEIKLNAEECRICRQVLACAVELFSKTVSFKNRDKWERVYSLLEFDGNIEFETDELRLIISAFNIYYLLSAGETDKLSKYLRSNMHESEDMTAFFDAIRETACAGGYPEAYGMLQKRFKAALKNFVSARRFLPRKLYISDLHFYHGNMNRQMDKRGFEDEQRMNEYMLRQWQEHVNDKDEIYILGDFSFKMGPATNDILQQLPGKKYLIIGNHDHYLDDKKFDISLFEWVKPYAEIVDRKRKVILSHYPIFCYNGQNKVDREGNSQTYMLYGHVHNTFDEVLINSFIMQTRSSKRKSKYYEEPLPIPCNMINCFCMFSDYIPLTLDEWIELDENRRREIGSV